MLDDVLDYNLRIVFCGTAVGIESNQRSQYYANPTNKFWKTLKDTGLTTRMIAPSEYANILEFKLGLTDLNKIDSGNDDTIDINNYDCKGLIDKIINYKPGVLCFNGKKAAKVFFNKKTIKYGFQAEKIGNTEIFVCPSTSGQASAYWNEKYWYELADYVISTES